MKLFLPFSLFLTLSTITVDGQSLRGVQEARVLENNCEDIGTDCEMVFGYDADSCTIQNDVGEYMRTNCKKICGLCTPSPTPSPTVTPPTESPTRSPVAAYSEDCSDLSDQCAEYLTWVGRPPYDCSIVKDNWVRDNCQESCGYCKGPKTLENLWLDLASTERYDEEWYAFKDGPEATAYQKISDYITQHHYDDIRPLYAGSNWNQRDDWTTWITYDDGIDDLEEAAASDYGCDHDCFVGVKTRLLEEIQLLDDMFTYQEIMYAYIETAAEQTVNSLNTVKTLLDNSSKDVTPDKVPPPTNGWTDEFIQIGTGIGMATSPIPSISYLGNSVAAFGHLAKFAYGLDGSNDSGNSQLDALYNNLRGFDTENDRMNLQVVNLIEKANRKKDDLISFFNRTMYTIFENYGRLKTFDDSIYGGGQQLPRELDVRHAANQTSYYDYHAFKLLFPTKYGICMEKNKFWDYHRVTHKECYTGKVDGNVLLPMVALDDTAGVYHSTVPEVMNGQPEKVDITCLNTVFSYYCTYNDVGHAAPSSLVRHYESTYKKWGPSPKSEDSDQEQCIQDAIDSDYQKKWCEFNGIRLSMHKVSDCVQPEWDSVSRGECF